jgi:hypothetical protein
MEPQLPSHPLAHLPAEDLDFILRFVLLSGSLKDLGTAYGVSYPTIRSRLDRLIERVRRATEGQEPDPFLDRLADCVEQGEIAVGAGRRLRQVYLERIAQLRGGASA